MAKESAVSYSRPCDPREPNYQTTIEDTEKKLARAVQLHTCSTTSCLNVINGVQQCKCRAPFVLLPMSWVAQDGSWGPKRTCGYLNNWNPLVLYCCRSNNDVKIVMNAGETKDMAWYITNYTGKKQHRSSNTSALLVTRVAFHTVQEQRTTDVSTLNCRLLQCCANTLSRDQELSAPEVVSYLMGWGDRYLSHSYTLIYLDSLTAMLHRFYPEL
jgi:hypothetical protein